jgi:tetratricopeptide (TPR) repeat protein
VPRYREQLAVNHNTLGCLLRELGRLAEAEAAHRRSLALQEKLAAEFSAVPRYQVQLAGSLVNSGHLLRKQQRPAEALSRTDRALALLQALRRREPRDPTTRQSLCGAHAGRAQALDDLRRHREALADWDRALELSPPAERPAAQLARARSRLLAGKAAEAVADVEALARDRATPGFILYNAACVYALAAALPDGPGRREGYAGRALALLRRAQGAGFFKDRRNVGHLKRDTDLEALRTRDEFQKLVAELEAAAAKP